MVLELVLSVPSREVEESGLGRGVIATDPVGQGLYLLIFSSLIIQVFFSIYFCHSGICTNSLI